MDLRQLQALLAVAEHQSFSAAARSLHTVQSNVSTHVARLEKEVDALLIHRPRCELTAEGKVVADRARRVLAEIRSIEDDLVSIRHDVAGTVRLGIIGTAGRWLMTPLLVALKNDHPRVDLRVIEATTTSLIPEILTDTLDLAIVNLPVHDPDIDTTPLFCEERIIVAPNGHPLASADHVSLRDVSRYEILLPPPGTAFRDAIDIDAERAGVELKVMAEVDGVRLLTSLAFQGYGPAIVPAGSTPQWLEGDWKRVWVDGLSDRQVGIAFPRRTLPSAPTRTTMEVIRQIIAHPEEIGVHIKPDASLQPVEDDG